MNANSNKTPNARVAWYRTPLDKETLARLNAKSDFKGFAQALGHLSLMTLTGTGVLWLAARGYYWALPFALFLHGTVSSFTINPVHELLHKCVFKTQWLNTFFVRIFAFIGWHNHDYFYASHMRHHQYTLHPPDDLEVVLPSRWMPRDFLRYGIINHVAALPILKTTIRLARGRFEGEWEATLFPEGATDKREPVIRWSRVLLIGHALILLISLAAGVLLSPVWFLVPVVVSLTRLYGGLLQFLCDFSQHMGMQDNVTDFRLCCRTFTAHPMVQFLYWHMNYHIEHHMYAAVPCYNLGKLHRTIEHDLPPTPKGLLPMWRDIWTILRRQENEPGYQFAAELPAHRNAPLQEYSAPSASVAVDAQLCPDNA